MMEPREGADSSVAPSALRRALPEWLNRLEILNYTAIIAIAGGLLWTLIGLAYERFYREFGVSPDEVGATPAALIPRTAVALAVVILLATGAFSFVVALCVLTQRLMKKSLELIVTLLLALSASAAIWPALIALTVAPVIVSPRYASATLLACGALFVGPLLTLLIRRYLEATITNVLLVAIWGCLLSGLFLLAVVSIQSRAVELATGVLLGRSIPPSGATFVFSFRADPVCITLPGSDATDGSSAMTYGLYLGESNGRIVVYDPVKRLTSQFAADDAILTFIPRINRFVPTSDSNQSASFCAQIDQ